MDPFLLIEWVGAYVVVAGPPRVRLAWRLEELESASEDPEEIESDREVYEKGLAMVRLSLGPRAR